MTNPASQPAIPTAVSLYQEEINRAKWIKVAELSQGDEIAVANTPFNKGDEEDFKADIRFVKIIKIELLPPEQVYDIEVEGTHNFVANGIIAHNTYIYGNLTAAGINIGNAVIGQADVNNWNGYQSRIMNHESWINTASTTLSFDASGGLVIGKIALADATSTPEVQIIDPTEITASSTQAAFVVNQVGIGEIADFMAQGVSVMSIAQTGEVKVVGSMLVDGRIMLCTGGQCSNALDSATDATMADLGVEGKVVAGAFEGYCDDGYVWAPGSAKYGTLPGFCVMSDLMNTDGAPQVNVSQGEAQYACQSLGAGYHLIGENEWLTITENILAAGNNLASSTEFKLTNDNVINNLTGSVAQWTNQNVTAAGLPITPLADSWFEYSEVSDYKGLNIAPDYYLTDANNYIGKIYIGSGTGLRGFVRGSGGIYGLDLSHAPSEQSENIGFRCAK